MVVLMASVVQVSAFDVQQYETIANSVLQTSKANVMKLQDSTLNMANQFVNIDTTTTTSTTSWPYVLLNNFEDIAIDIMTNNDDGGGIQLLDQLAYSPLVTPENLITFESFALQQRIGGTTTTTTGSGADVWGVDSNTKQKYHDNFDGLTSWNSPKYVYFPILQHNLGSKHDILLYNLHSDPTTGKLIDNVLDCAASSGAASTNTSCGLISNLIIYENIAVPSSSSSARSSPSSAIIQPIVIDGNKGTTTGIIFSSFQWTNVLKSYDLSSSITQNLLGVLSTASGGAGAGSYSSDSNTVTYSINKGGSVYFFGYGDLHDTKLDQYNKSISLVEGINDDDNDNDGSPTYTLTIYPASGSTCVSTTMIVFWLSIITTITTATVVFF